MFDSPTSNGSQAVDLSQPKSVLVDTHKLTPKEEEEHRGQARATSSRSNNNECQSIVDDLGNVVSTPAGSLLSAGEPVFGVVSGGSYVYYMVRYRLTIYSVLVKAYV